MGKCIRLYPIEPGNQRLLLPAGTIIADVRCRDDDSGIAIVVIEPADPQATWTYHLRVVAEAEPFQPEHRIAYIGWAFVPQVGPVYVVGEGVTPWVDNPADPD